MRVDLNLALPGRTVAYLKYKTAPNPLLQYTCSVNNIEPRLNIKCGFKLEDFIGLRLVTVLHITSSIQYMGPTEVCW